MQKRSSMYSMISLAIILFGTVFMFQISGENQRALMKGYKISFPFLYGCGGMPSTPRLYSKYYFTADKLHNDSTLQAFQQKLGIISKSYDSLHGVDITFSDMTPYEYYMKTLAICHEYPPKQIIPYEHHIYARSMSRYQLREDSIDTATMNLLDAYELDMSYP